MKQLIFLFNKINNMFRLIFIFLLYGIVFLFIAFDFVLVIIEKGVYKTITIIDKFIYETFYKDFLEMKNDNNIN